MPNIIRSVEGPRGCGYRKAGGMYLVQFDGQPFPCGRFPIPLTCCPTCGAGIKPARGFTWIDPRPFIAANPCKAALDDCAVCPMSVLHDLQRVGLIWIGEQFYPTADAFRQEAQDMGISRRISRVPKGFKVGKTWVMLAHRKPDPHIFLMFKPSRMDYIVKGDETDEALEALEKSGFTLVKVEPMGSTAGLPLANGGEEE